MLFSTINLTYSFATLPELVLSNSFKGNLEKSQQYSFFLRHTLSHTSIDATSMPNVESVEVPTFGNLKKANYQRSIVRE